MTAAPDAAGGQEPDDFVQVAVADRIAWLTLNEPARLNPVTLARIQAINDAASAISARNDVRVLVVTGAGRGFCSGVDLADKSLRATSVLPPASGSILNVGRGVWTLSAVRQPVIAMLNGAAVGFGAELAMQADFRIAGASAKLGFPFARIGAVGYERAAEILFTGEVLTAAQAAMLGLVGRVVPDENLRSATAEFAARLAAGDPAAVQALKQMMIQGRDQTAAAHVALQFELANRHRPNLETAFRNSRGPSAGDTATTHTAPA